VSAAAANFVVSADEDDNTIFKLALLDDRRIAVVATAVALTDGTAIPFTEDAGYTPDLTAECCDVASDSPSIHHQKETAPS